MSDIITGFVKKINRKEMNGKSGPFTAYSLRVELENGAEFSDWISLGFKPPAFKEGDYGSFALGKNARGYATLEEYKALKNPPKQQQAAASAGYKSGSGPAGDTRQSAIHYQSSRSAAIAAVEILHKLDAIPLSGAKTKAGEAKRYEEVIALIDKLTVRYFNDCETHRLLESVVDDGASKKDAGKLPDDEDVDPTPDDDEE
jgi:hypothetical protein